MHLTQDIMTDSLYKENLSEWINDDKKLVTYHYLSITLGVHVNLAKQMLYEFYQQELTKTKNGECPLEVMFYVSGTRQNVESNTDSKETQDGPISYISTLCPAEKLTELKNKLLKIFSIHVHSVKHKESKETLEEAARETLELSNEGRAGPEFGPYKTINQQNLGLSVKKEVNNTILKPEESKDSSFKTPENKVKQLEPMKKDSLKAPENKISKPEKNTKKDKLKMPEIRIRRVEPEQDMKKDCLKTPENKTRKPEPEQDSKKDKNKSKRKYARIIISSESESDDDDENSDFKMHKNNNEKEKPRHKVDIDKTRIKNTISKNEESDEESDNDLGFKKGKNNKGKPEQKFEQDKTKANKMTFKKESEDESDDEHSVFKKFIGRQVNQGKTQTKNMTLKKEELEDESESDEESGFKKHTSRKRKPEETIDEDTTKIKNNNMTVKNENSESGSVNSNLKTPENKIKKSAAPDPAYNKSSKKESQKRLRDDEAPIPVEKKVKKSQQIINGQARITSFFQKKV